MIMLAILALVAAAAFFSACARERGAPQPSRSITALRVGAGIAVVRLVLFCCGTLLYVGYADWRQGLGYALLILSSVVELALSAALSGGDLGPELLTAGLIVVTSLLLGAAWAWIRFRPRSKEV